MIKKIEQALKDLGIPHNGVRESHYLSYRIDHQYPRYYFETGNVFGITVAEFYKLAQLLKIPPEDIMLTTDPSTAGIEVDITFTGICGDCRNTSKIAELGEYFVRCRKCHPKP